MAFYLALDVGGTKTEYVLADDTHELARVRGGTIKRMRTDATTATQNLDAALAGTFSKPTYEGELLVHDRVEVKPTGGDTTLHGGFGIRLIEAGFVHTNLPNNAADSQNDLRLGFGLSYRH